MKKRLAALFEISHSKHEPIRSMEGLRGFACCLVFLVHYATAASSLIGENSVTRSVSDVLWHYGHAGVDLFFVLSGFLIYGMLIRRPQPFSSYLMRRIQRIYPTFAVVFVLYIAFSYIAPAQSKIPNEAGAAAKYLLQNFFLLPGIFSIEPMITVAWSLSYEFAFYLIVPIVIGALSLREWKFTNRLLLLVSLAGAGFALTMLFGGHIQMLIFVAGMILYEVTSNTKLSPGKNIGAFALLVSFLGTSALMFMDVHGGIRYVVLFLTFFVLCWECFTTNGPITRFFSLTPIRWFGNMSYSYYLIHVVALKGFFIALGPALGFLSSFQLAFWLLMPIAFSTTVVVGAFLFVFIERPFSLARPAPVPAAATATPLGPT